MAAPMKSPAPMTATEALRGLSMADGSLLPRRAGLPGELLLHDLAGGIGRHCVEDDDLGRPLVGSQALTGEGGQVVRRGRRTRAQLDEGHHLLVARHLA